MSMETTEEDIKTVINNWNSRGHTAFTRKYLCERLEPSVEDNLYIFHNIRKIDQKLNL